MRDTNRRLPLSALALLLTATLPLPAADLPTYEEIVASFPPDTVACSTSAGLERNADGTWSLGQVGDERASIEIREGDFRAFCAGAKYTATAVLTLDDGTVVRPGGKLTIDAEGAFVRISGWQGGPHRQLQTPEAAGEIERRRVSLVQESLARLGYRPGAADGRVGPNTSRAIREFQRVEGLPVDGAVTAELEARLKTAGTSRSVAAQPPPKPKVTESLPPLGEKDVVAAEAPATGKRSPFRIRIDTGDVAEDESAPRGTSTESLAGSGAASAVPRVDAAKLAAEVARRHGAEDLVNLIMRNKVEVEVNGSGIEAVSVRIRRRFPTDLKVFIPVGTFFVSGRTSAQNMVTTTERVVELQTDGWVTSQVAAACANRPRDVPGSGDTFTVQRSPNQGELELLMPVLRSAGAGTEIRQAAVWIVTDDATYDDLGVLVSVPMGMPSGYGGSRVIGELHAATAMRICADAGIDVTRKAIWRDRARILRELDDPGLRYWMESLDEGS